MHDNETQQMILKIIEHAQTAKLSEFRSIRNWSDYRYHRGKRRSFKLIVKALEKGSDRLFKRYCNSIIDGDGNFNQLVAYQQLYHVIRFYQQELTTIESMLKDFEVRVWNIL
jgi:hypothetical protein